MMLRLSLNWSRCAPKGHTLSIRLIHLDLEESQDCENDAVKVYSNGNLISVLCGKRDFEELQSAVNPSLVSSPDGCLSLSFYSDYSNTRRHTGFRGFYSSQDYDECESDPDNRCTQFCHNFIGGYYCSCRHGYHLDTDKHTCTENAKCQHTLSVEPNLQLELHFSDVFDVEQSPDGQCIDALRIVTHTGTLGPFCGNTPPPSPFLTHSHHVQIRFTSDGFGTNKGFSLHFVTRDKVCPAEVTPHSTAAPPKSEYRQGQTVTVTCDVGYAVDTQGTLALSSEYETTCLNTGVWSPSYSCEHTYTCNANGEWESGDGETKMPKCIEVCGRPKTHPASTGRILGGKDANLGEIPWHLLIKEPRRGGASLINDRWAVTAAHVVENVVETSLVLYGGLVDAKHTRPNKGRELIRSSNVVVMNSTKIIIHPLYTSGIKDRTDFDNDIALIKLASRVSLGPNLLPICLPEANSGLVENEQGTISGFGMTESEKSDKMVTSVKLKYAHIGVYPVSQCQDTPHANNNRRMVYTDNMFCAGAAGKDSCHKDSGGPFVLPMLAAGREPYYLKGIVSWGPPCEDRQFKGYYTKVENYLDWIKAEIAQN
ncbi:Complement C1s subcomponent [Collichthys lucidus]|uniref:Complement C1s subcomponent n=1 Tax=Collichthys lucidus TaxID=240159 RepID=A0A4U5V399_COLLU|nr:Complement C1s subcomponent [Collichthys lucidus]